jgi:hypothetical protein
MVRLVRTLTAASVLAFGVSACMLFSGVDDLEVRKDGTSNAPTPGESGSPSGNVSNGSKPSSDASSGPPKGDVDASDGGANKPAQNGALVCGAQGTWSACTVGTMFTTCATYCVSIGKSCVDSCCASDTSGNFPGQLGMYYALGMTCSVDAMPSSSSWGLCADPILPFGDVRCCCR